MFLAATTRELSSFKSPEEKECMGVSTAELSSALMRLVDSGSRSPDFPKSPVELERNRGVSPFALSEALKLYVSNLSDTKSRD